MQSRKRSRSRLLRRGAGLVLLALLASGSGILTAPGSGGGGGGGAPITATYITQTPDAGLSNEQALSSLSSGLLFSTTGSGVVSVYGGFACSAGNFAYAISGIGGLACNPSQVGVTEIINGTHLLARTFADNQGNTTRIEIWPQATDKPDEGAAGTAGTIAWAETQLPAGGEIFLHTGTYNVGTTITMDTAGMTLRCTDPASAEIKAKSTLVGAILRLGWAGAQRQGMQVIGCGFNGNPASATTETAL